MSAAEDAKLRQRLSNNSSIPEQKLEPPRSKMWRNVVVDSQDYFRRQGWNLAGSNLLALAVGLANRHYLYVRPRLTPRDFGFALIPMVIGTLLATLIAYLSFGTTVLPQMAALGCVLGLLGELNLTYTVAQIILDSQL